jgi:glycosyltransferase involved in cell wall biosynthesis
MQPEQIGVVVTTYNAPRWLEKVLVGYEQQTFRDFRTIVADDGSGDDTRALIDAFAERSALTIDHVRHEDLGFRKCTILNKAIARTSCDYLIFTDGDCIPEPDFVATHRRLATPGTFLSGGYVKLTMEVSEAIGEQDIRSGAIFDRRWLIDRGQPRTRALWKLSRTPFLERLLNALTPTTATWNGMNSSTWRRDLLAVNGFNEEMLYGGLDRELGERLWNYGQRSKQIRYSTVCLHLDHARGYSRPEIWNRNRAIRDAVKRDRTYWTPHGIDKTSAAPSS